MKHVNSRARRSGFHVLADGTASQAAVMILQPGESSSDRPEDEHPWAEQWVLVTAGRGRAKGRSRSRSIALKEGSLLLIEKREPHQITNTGHTPLVTINFYAPRAYRKDGNLRPPPSVSSK